MALKDSIPFFSLLIYIDAQRNPDEDKTQRRRQCGPGPATNSHFEIAAPDRRN